MILNPIEDVVDKPQNFMVTPTTSIHKLSAILINNNDNNSTTPSNEYYDFSNWVWEKYGDQ